MRAPATLVLHLIISGMATVACASEPDQFMDSTKVSILLRGQALLFDDRFDAVDSLYDSYIATYPDDPAGYLFKAAAKMGEMTDAEENLFEDLSKKLLDSVDTIVDRRRLSTTGRTAAWLHLFAGHALAYRALYESRFGSFFSAVRFGRAARSEYDKGLSADSSLYDLYLGLGSYHYWKSAKGGVLRFFKLLKNEEDKGIAELYLAADSSLLSREAARSALIWIRLDRKEYDSAIALTEEYLQAYPNGKSFMWPKAQAYFYSERYDSALAVYRRLRDRLFQEPGNYFNLLEVEYFICRCLEKLDRKNEAVDHAENLRDYYKNISREIRNRQRSRLAYLSRLSRE